MINGRLRMLVSLYSTRNVLKHFICTIIGMWCVKIVIPCFILARVASFYVSKIEQQFGSELYPNTLLCKKNNQPCMDTVTVTDTLEDGDELDIEGN